MGPDELETTADVLQELVNAGDTKDRARTRLQYLTKKSILRPLEKRSRGRGRGVEGLYARGAGKAAARARDILESGVRGRTEKARRMVHLMLKSHSTPLLTSYIQDRAVLDLLFARPTPGLSYLLAWHECPNQEVPDYDLVEEVGLLKERRTWCDAEVEMEWAAQRFGHDYTADGRAGEIARFDLLLSLRAVMNPPPPVLECDEWARQAAGEVVEYQERFKADLTGALRDRLPCGTELVQTVRGTTERAEHSTVLAETARQYIGERLLHLVSKWAPRVVPSAVDDAVLSAVIRRRFRWCPFHQGPYIRFWGGRQCQLCNPAEEQRKALTKGLKSLKKGSPRLPDQTAIQDASARALAAGSLCCGATTASAGALEVSRQGDTAVRIPRVQCTKCGEPMTPLVDWLEDQHFKDLPPLVNWRLLPPHAA